MIAAGAGYVLLGRRGDAGLTLPSEALADGSRAVAGFGDEAGAEASRIVGGLGEDWRVVADTPRAVAEILQAAAPSGVEYVALNPRRRSPAATRSPGWSRYAPSWTTSWPARVGR